MTSLDAAGFSITLLKATPDMVAALDKPTTAVGWPQAAGNYQKYHGAQVIETSHEPTSEAPPKATGPKSLFPSLPYRLGRDSNSVLVDVAQFTKAVTAACQSVIAAEPQITHNDRIVGDGDCGTTLSRGANAALKAISDLNSSATAGSAILRIAHAVESSMDGTSGAIYELFFTALASAVQGQPGESATLATWAQAASEALERLQAMTPARVGDRTVMDALTPYIQTLSSSGDVTKAVEEARKGRDSTKGMQASLGRAVYVAGENWDKVPDPGAEGVVAIVEGLAKP